MKTRKRECLRGQAFVLFAVVVVAVAAMCVFAIDVGRVYFSGAQLQNAVDSAALAGASQLTGFMTDQERALATQEALALAEANVVDGIPLHVTPSDIEFGHYDAQTRQFIPEPGAVELDSIRVTGRRNAGSIDGPIPLFFGAAFGWNNASFDSVTAVGTKPRRYAMFVLDRSGSMCFDTTGVVEKYSPLQDAEGFYMEKSPSGWYWFPKYVYVPYYWWNRRKTAYFYAKDDATGAIVTDFLPDHIKSRLINRKYFRFRQRDRPDNVLSGWLKVPSNVTIYCRYDTGNWKASSYYWVVGSCDYAISTNPVQPLQSTMDAACAFVDLLDPNDDKAGLVTYAWGATLDQQLTADWASLQDQLQSFEPSGATAEGDGMKAAIDELALSGRAAGYGHKIMILLTDGNANVRNGGYYTGTESYYFMGQWVQDCGITEYVARELEEQTIRAKEEGIRIYCVGFGAGADTKLQPIIASETNGAYYYAPTHQNLTEIFIDIFRRLPPILTF